MYKSIHHIVTYMIYTERHRREHANVVFLCDRIPMIIMIFFILFYLYKNI